MTYSGHSIVDFRDAVFKAVPHMRLKVTTTRGANPDYSGDVNGLIKFFIGFKHSEIISDMECEVGVNDVKISNSNMVKSLYIAQKTRGEEILSTPFEHTLWRKLAELDSGVSGTYFKANLIDEGR
jgi:hypothetical protein